MCHYGFQRNDIAKGGSFTSLLAVDVALILNLFQNEI